MMKFTRAVCLALAAANLWLYWRVLRPLRHLASDSRKLTEGDFTALSHSDGAMPEIEALRTAMNAMVGHVRRAQAQEKTYIEALTSGQEAERARIARELHDDTTQSLIAIAQLLEITNGLVEPESQVSQMLQTARQQAVETVQNLRVLIANLRPPSLAELGLIPALQMLTEGTHKAIITLETRGRVRRLSEMQELVLFRSAQEAVWNAQRHGDAQHIVIRVRYTKTATQMIVQDDGGGFAPPKAWHTLAEAGHFGLVGIYERIQLLRGTMQVNSRLGIGTSLEISIPVEDNPQPGDVVRDPVCSTLIQPQRAYASVDYKGTHYYFCCPVCQGAFQTDPEVYLCVESHELSATD